MNTSYYFEELASAYDAEIDDLTSNSEGKTVLTARLKEKRKEFDSLLQLIEFAPEMVIPVFYGAFTFTQPNALWRALQCEPDDGDFPFWDDMANTVTLADWALPLAQEALSIDGGDRFLVTAAAIEFLRTKGSAPASSSRQAKELDEDNDQDDRKDSDGDDDDDRDLGEAGADWLSEQGFDSHSS